LSRAVWARLVVWASLTVQVAVILHDLRFSETGFGIWSHIQQGQVEILVVGEETGNKTHGLQRAVFIADGEQEMSVHVKSSQVFFYAFHLV
jgi:hypothetical protein